MNDLTKKLLFGKNCENLDNIVTVQTLSCSSAFVIGADFLKKFGTIHEVHIPKPTWNPHFSIFENSKFKTFEYPYYDEEEKKLI